MSSAIGGRGYCLSQTWEDESEAEKTDSHRLTRGHTLVRVHVPHAEALFFGGALVLVASSFLSEEGSYHMPSDANVQCVRTTRR